MQKNIADIIRTITDCAKQYDANLVNNNLLFVSLTEADAACLEVAFMPQNFKHLTGIVTTMTGLEFFDAAVQGQLGESRISMARDGTTQMKLDVLPRLMSIHKSAKLTGSYDQSGSFLVTEKLVGTTTAALGFVYNNKYGWYYPNTALKDDVRNITRKPQQRIIATFRKRASEPKYTELTYIAKGFAIGDKILQPILDEKADRHALMK